MRPYCRMESFHITETRKEIDCFKADRFCEHFNTVFEAIVCFYLLCLSPEGRPALVEEDCHCGTKKWQLDGLKKQYIGEKSYTLAEV